MKALSIKSTAVVGFPLVALLACSSENLQTSGLEPGSGTTPSTPTTMTPTTPVTTPSQPTTPTTEPTTPATNDQPASEGNPDGIAPPEVDPADDMMGSGDDTPDPMTTPEPETPDPEPTVPPEVILTPSQIGGDLEGFLHRAPCQSQDFGHDCTLPDCQGGSKTTELTLQLGGEVGKIYDVSIHVYGVVEPRVYQGGVRRAGNNFDVNGSDFWYEGGSIPANTGTYNSFEFHVEPPVPGAPNVYFLNSKTGGDTPMLIRLNYEATFPIQGGGTIRFRSFDLNCRQITNCTTTECGPLTPKPLSQDLVRAADPPPPADFPLPYQTGANIGRGQWFYVDVVDAAARP